MDMMSGLIASNAPIGQQDVMGNYVKAYKTGIDANKVQAETAGVEQDTRKKSYQQDLTEKLQKSIHESVDPATGNINPDKFKIVAHQNGVDPQAIDYALDNILKVWTTAQGVAKAKNAVGAVSETGAQKVQEANTPSGAGWSNQPATRDDRGSLAAPKATSLGQPTSQADVNADKTGFLTQDMVQEPKSDYRYATTGVEGEGRSTVSPTLTAQAPEVPDAPAPEVVAQGTPGLVSTISGIQPDAGTSVQPKALPTNPIQVAELDPRTQKLLVNSMKQEGRITKDTKMGNYGQIAQDSLNSMYQSYLGTVGNQPTKQMFTDKDGNVDMGAFNRATSEYNAKVASADKSFRDDVAKKYGEQFAQGMTVAANKRAEQASSQSKTGFEQVQDRIANIKGTEFEGGKLGKGITAENVAEVEKNVTSYKRIEGAVKTIQDLKNDPNLDKMTADQLAAKLKNFNTTMGQVEGLSTESQRETLEEGIRKNPAYADLVRKYAKDAELSITGLVDAVKKIGVEKMTAQDRRTFLDLLGSPAEDALKHGAAVSALRIHASAPESKGGWAGKPAKAGKGAKAPEAKPAGIVRKPGEKLSDFIKRGGSI